MTLFATIVAARALAEPVHDTVPRQVGWPKVRQTTHLARSVRMSGTCRDIAIRRDHAVWHLRGGPADQDGPVGLEYYRRNWSLALDLRILIRTLGASLRGRRTL